MKYVVDTNVPIVANNRLAEQASPDCVLTCVQQLQAIRQHHVVVIDDGWHILREYQRKLSPSGQPGVGDAFLKWLLRQQYNPRHCERVTMLAHPDKPPILNATDSDWWHHRHALAQYKVEVIYLCPHIVQEVK